MSVYGLKDDLKRWLEMCWGYGEFSTPTWMWETVGREGESERKTLSERACTYVHTHKHNWIWLANLTYSCEFLTLK